MERPAFSTKVHAFQNCGKQRKRITWNKINLNLAESKSQRVKKEKKKSGVYIHLIPIDTPMTAAFKTVDRWIECNDSSISCSFDYKYECTRDKK